MSHNDLSCVVMFNPLLPVQLLPTIVKLFASNDRAIRVGLLQHIDQFGESFSAQIVDEQVCSNYDTTNHYFILCSCWLC